MKPRRLLSWLWLLVLLTPAIRLPGDIPFRAEDVVIFGLLGWWTIEWLTGRSQRICEVAVVLVLISFYTVIVTMMGSPRASLSVGPKEWLDFVRPLKFAAIMLIAPREQAARQWKSFLAAVSGGAWILTAFSLAQVLLLDWTSRNALARLSFLYTDIPDQVSRMYLGYRAFGTFNTPTDLGYYGMFILLLALARKDMPFRPAVMVMALLLVVLSGTRTFIYIAPLLFLFVGITARGGVKTKLRYLFAALVLSAIGFALLAYVFTGFSQYILGTARNLARGEFQDDDSIRIRLENLHLARYTWDTAPWTGVISRDMFYSGSIGGVDSEYLMTFHRYGVIGLSLTFALYLAILHAIWTGRRGQNDTAWALVFIELSTFVYGVTQGALVNTRVGSFWFIALALYLHSAERKARRRRNPGTNASQLIQRELAST